MPKVISVTYISDRLGGMRHFLIASVATVSALTFLANILGFVRELVVASRFGATATSDSFFSALSLVSMIFLIFSAGTIQLALIPRYEALRSANDGARAVGLARSVGVMLITVLGVMTAGVFIFAHTLAKVAFPGFEAERLTLTVEQIRIMAAMIALVGTGAFFQSILNAHREFWQGALVPVLINVLVIASVLLLSAHIGVTALAWGMVAGASLWILLLAPYALPWLAGKSASTSGDLRCVLIAFASIGGVTALDQLVAVYQKSLASGYESGIISALSYGGRLVGLPMGFLGLAMATVMLPAFVAAVARGRREETTRVFETGLLGLFAVILPIGATLVVLAEAIVALLFARGAFDQTATENTALALRWYAMGLPAQVAMPLMARMFFAVERPGLVIAIGAVSAVIWLVLTNLLVGASGWIGIAQATLIYAYVHAFIQLAYLKMAVDVDMQRLAFSVGRLLLGLPVLVALLQIPLPNDLVGLAVKMPLGMAAYLATIGLLGDRSVLNLLRLRWP